MASTTDAPPDVTPDPAPGRYWAILTIPQWVTFIILSGAIAAVNIYSTLKIGWGDTGSIIAVLASVFFLSVLTRHKADVHTLNLGQTMVSAGGSVGFAVASYAAVRIIDPSFQPHPVALIILFTGMGWLGAIIGATVRKRMVGYFFPSGTACAVIQRSVTKELAPGERNRPVFMLVMWGSLAGILTIPTKIAMDAAGTALVRVQTLWESGPGAALQRSIELGVDPLYYGIGIVVGPRIGIGMALGGLATPFLIMPSLFGGPLEPETGDWVRWIAIAVLTLPTFATIVFAYLFRQPPVVPSGFTPGATTYVPPANRNFLYGMLVVLTGAVIAWGAWKVFGMPWYASIVTMAIAYPLCIVNGRVTGDTDINPVRLVAVVLLSGFFWLVAGAGAITMLGMAVVAGTLAAVAVDMMQDYRTGYLVDANPTHQTSVQFVGSLVGAIVAIPVLDMLLSQLGIGEGSQLPAPGAQVWAAMAEAMAEVSESGGLGMSNQLIWAIALTSIIGCGYAYLTVWPKSAALMPSLFGVGIGLLLGTEACLAIFAGGLIKWVVTLFYTRGKTDEALAEAQSDASNDTMLAGASVFAAGAVVAIVLILLTPALDAAGINWWFLAH